jgi:acyl-CoA reductase-like NAD-dependent aldehyde dehydrogenase
VTIVTMRSRDTFYIGGKWVSPLGSGVHEVIDSATEEVLGTVPSGDARDVDAAVRAAADAFPEWSRTPVAERARLLTAISERLATRSAELGELVSREIGMPQQLATTAQAGMAVRDFASMAEVVSAFPFEEVIDGAQVVREPVGVVGAITPWNFPVHQIACKASAALAAGCTIVVKPSEVAPLTAFLLAEVIDEAGLPAGVFNLVTGTGEVAGEALAGHPLVDMVSFTGSTRAGKRVMELASASVKKVALELGGKSPDIILDDADLEAAVRHGVDDAFRCNGQVCSALTRMIVPRSLLSQVEAIAVEHARSYQVGDPADPATKLGPVVSARQRDAVRGYIAKGVADGARLLTGGAEQPDGHDRGYFIQPTVFTDVTNDMTIAREEIFGPVLSIIAYDTEQQAIDIANDTPYGLSSAVWSRDPDRAARVARQVRAGKVVINGGAWTPYAPFGGYKQSGLGRELGRYGLEDYLEVKSMIAPR